MTNPDAKFRRDTLNTMSSYAESTNLRLDRTEQALSRLIDGISELTVSVKAQTANMDRLERAVLRMVETNEQQRETVNSLIKLCTTLVEKVA